MKSADGTKSVRENWAERLESVMAIGAEISNVRDVDALLRLVMDRLTKLLSAEASSLFVVDEARGELWSRVIKGSALKDIRMPVSQGIAGHVVTTARSLNVSDAYADPRFNSDVDKKSGFKTRSIIAVPLKHMSGRILGVVEVLDPRPNRFRPDDLVIVEAVAAHIAGVLDNMLLMEQLRAQNDKLTQTTNALREAVQDLDVLYEVERSVSSAEERTDLLDRILQKAMGVMGAGAGSILLLEDERDSLFFRNVAGEKSDALVLMPLRAGQGIAGYVAASGKSVRVAKADDSEHYDKSVAKKLGVSVGSVLCVPIVGEGTVLGSLELLNKVPEFTPTDERLATLLAGQTGRAIALRKSREEGERKARLASIGQMLSGVLHDVRTPMTIISGFADLMVDDPDPTSRGDAAAMIRSQLDHLNMMTRETLAFARGETDVFLQKVYLQHFVQEVGAHLEKEFAGGPVELKVQANYTGAARLDAGKVKRVVYNLARNAREAMPEGGRFTFVVDREGVDLVFKFIDNGPGIPPDIADRLFQSFVTSGKKDGTGLGLAMAKKIADDHKGSIVCKSRPGKGTTFELRLPAGLPAD